MDDDLNPDMDPNGISDLYTHDDVHLFVYRIHNAYVDVVSEPYADMDSNLLLV